MNREDIINLSLEFDEQTRQFRHDLHMIPELALNEFKTASYIRNVLDSNSIPYIEIGTGTVVDIEVAKGKSFTAFRSDIDALQIAEEAFCDFSSKHEGCMHACGHDCHTAMLLATALILWKNKDKVIKNVRLIFQPAEEAFGGAQRMIEAGCLKSVSDVFCLHMLSGKPVGQFATKTGFIHASSDGIVIKVHGVKAHGASPQTGVDAIVIASNIVLALQTLISRETSAFDSAVLTVGKICGGQARNVVCDEVVMDATLRSLGNELRERLISRIKEVCDNIAKAHNGSAEVELVQSYCPCWNDEAKTIFAINTLKNLYGDDCVDNLNKTSMGGEDFGAYERLVPGCKLYIGTGFNENIHTGTFRVNDDTLRYGVGFFLALAFIQ